MITPDEEQLAYEFIEHPVHVCGIYRTVLRANMIYDGHREKRTEKVLCCWCYKDKQRFILRIRMVRNIFIICNQARPLSGVKICTWRSMSETGTLSMY